MNLTMPFKKNLWKKKKLLLPAYGREFKRPKSPLPRAKQLQRVLITIKPVIVKFRTHILVNVWTAQCSARKQVTNLCKKQQFLLPAHGRESKRSKSLVPRAGQLQRRCSYHHKTCKSMVKNPDSCQRINLTMFRKKTSHQSVQEQ